MRLLTAMGWRVRGSNPGGGNTFRIRPDQHWAPPTTSFPGVKQPVHGIVHPPPSTAEVKERVQLYIYFPPRAFKACSRVNFLPDATCQKANMISEGFVAIKL
jgi:hypothetical protein